VYCDGRSHLGAGINGQWSLAMRNRSKVLSFLFFFVTLSALGAVPADERNLAPLVNANLKAVIPNQYIVVFRPVGRTDGARTDAASETIEQSEAAQRLAVGMGGKVTHVYRAALVGFSAKLSPEALKAVRAAPGVAYVEADLRMRIDAVEQLPFSPPFPNVFPKGIDRTSERLLPLDGRYTHSLDGTGVNVYVIDSGIRATHTDFGGRVSGGDDEVKDGRGTDDCVGHGTHVAGSIGGTLYGIAKNVQLHPVRVVDCAFNIQNSDLVNAVEWVIANAVHPAVVNMSISGPGSPSLDTQVVSAVDKGVTFVVSAGWYNDACKNSPARVPSAITVASVNPDNDTRPSTSSFGTCVDLFGPGEGILSDSNGSDTDTAVDSGSSMASPHVAGVAALWLQNHPTDSPAQVLSAILGAANVSSTPGWAGVKKRGTGSPNILLHWGSAQNTESGVFDGENDGDPHLKTADGSTVYNFQGGGEYIALLGDDGMEIQTRETPVQTTTSFLGPDPYDGVASCVSLNTAAAMRVGGHRVTFEPNISGNPDPSGMQLRIDGALTALSAPIALSGGGRVGPSSVGYGIEVDFPDGTILNVTANWWPGQQLWYLDVDVVHSSATSGLMGLIPQSSWLPLTASGASVGTMPASVVERYNLLYHVFGDSWRVTNANSLFDYKPGTSPVKFRVPGWPGQTPPCTVHGSPNPPAKPIDPQKAAEYCRDVADKRAKADCSFDVALTGEPGIAKLFLASRRFHMGATITKVAHDLRGSTGARAVIYTAEVTPGAQGNGGAPRGTIVFSVAGKPVSKPIPLDERGVAHWESTSINMLDQTVTATFTPASSSVYLPSTGEDEARRIGIK
jgi:hypothetical protein